MELKTARLTLLIDPNKKVAFERLCAQQDLTPSQVVRQLIRDYLAQHGVQYVGSGLIASESPPAADVAPPGTKPPSRHGAPVPGKRRTGLKGS
ncbi:CopG family transcriptional regulator [Polaromonas sp. C04]|mgnify:CR=1 FL=1|nr:ribbon-helix-helix domain-containing protein [Polaromonas sp. C04]OOG58630.1 CopG family transcriptional regulator [Polaromonas sp. C04]